MKERIIRLMSSKKLTAIRFAEIMGVRPSSISHIMSGRNNPSYDFILKVLENFPDVSPDWFILGKGNMYRINDAPQSDLSFEKGLNEDRMTDTQDDEMVFDSDFELDRSDSQLANNPHSIVSSTNRESSPEKNLQRVILLYDDGSFESYNLKNRV